MEHPVILKANEAIMGSDNYLIGSRRELEDVVTTNYTKQFVVQRYVENDGDYRVLSFKGGQSPLVFRRTAAVGLHLNNTSLGGSATSLSVNELAVEAMELALAAAVISKLDIAGVDIMQDKPTGEWFLLEVNSNPALFTGSLLADKSESYLQMIQEIIAR